MGTSKKDKAAIKQLMKDNEEFKKQMEALGITIENLEDKIDSLPVDVYANVNANYEEWKKTHQWHPPVVEPPVVDCGPKAHWDAAAGKCVPDVVTPPPTEPPTTTADKDPNGINKIYADKTGGVWIGPNNFSQEELTRNYASGKPSENSYECEYKDSNKLENEEVTFYTKINGFKSETDTISVKLLGNKHSDGSKDKWLIFQLMTDGGNEDNFQIEDPHPTNHDNHQPTLFTIGESIVGKAVGFKAITFIDEAGKRHAETWLDFPVADINNPPNNWRKYIDIVDVGKLSHGFVNATNGGALLRIDGTKKGDMPTTKFMSIREIAPEGGTTIPPVTPPVEPPTEPPTPPTEPPLPPTTGEKDENGIVIPFQRTGKSVALTTGNDHRNGQRYSINHKFTNYFLVGYFKTGKDQDQIELKTDGPNHGSCTSLPQCCWCEVDWAIKGKTHDNGRKTITGEMYISSEWPHPENHPPPVNQPSSKVITGNNVETWIGFGVAAFATPDGYRRIIGYGDTNPFGPDGKPLNNWVVGVDEIDKGQITNPELAKREIPINFDQGLEAEIRMNNGVNHDCEIKWAHVYEIIPPTA